MELLKNKIRTHGKVAAGNILKVDSFLNHQIDAELMAEIGKEFYRLYKDEGVNKIMTIEASGIAVGCMTALAFKCPLVFAKKNKTLNISGDVYTCKVESYTHKNTYDITVSKDFLNKGDKILIVDDFLAMGNALIGLRQLAEEAGAEVVGAGIVIEKAFQPGGDLLRKSGFRVESLARVISMSPEEGVQFID